MENVCLKQARHFFLVCATVCSKKVGCYFLDYSLCSNAYSLCSKQVGCCFLVYLSWIRHLMFYYEKCVFKASGKLPFTTNILKLQRSMLFNLLLFSLHRKLHKTSPNWCFLVCSSNFIRLLLTTAFWFLHS